VDLCERVARYRIRHPGLADLPRNKRKTSISCGARRNLRLDRRAPSGLHSGEGRANERRANRLDRHRIVPVVLALLVDKTTEGSCHHDLAHIDFHAEHLPNANVPAPWSADKPSVQPMSLTSTGVLASCLTALIRRRSPAGGVQEGAHEFALHAWFQA